MHPEMAEFLSDRLTALRSLDRAILEDYIKKYHIMSVPHDEKTFWAGIHKARVACIDLTEDERAFSRGWLAQHHVLETMHEQVSE